MISHSAAIWLRFFMPFGDLNIYRNFVDFLIYKAMNTKSTYCAKRNVRIQRRFDELIKNNSLSMLDIYFQLSEEFDLSTDRISEIIHKRRI